MALSNKDIVITPNRGQSADPQIVFSGADATTGAQNITIRAYPTNYGTLSFEGTAGQLFSVNNNTTGTIYAVNDVSGIPSIQVLDTGNIYLAPYGGNIGVGTTSPTLSSGTGIHIYNSAGNHANLKLGSTSRTWELLGTSSGYFSIYDTTGGADRLSITSAGGVAFGGSSNYGSSGQILQSNGNAAPTWVNASSITAGSASLTSTYVGYGSGSNTLTGSSSLTWNGSNFYINGALSAYAPDNSTINFSNVDSDSATYTNRSSRVLTSNGTNWVADGKDPILTLTRNNSGTTRGQSIGLLLHNENGTANSYSPLIGFSALSNSGSYNSMYAAIMGKKTGYNTGVDTNWNKGELHFFISGSAYMNDTPTMTIGDTGAISFNGSYGSSGQILQSNGNAAPTWINASSITAGSASSVSWANVTNKPGRTDWNSKDSIGVVVGQLSWKNYGNSHTIFDASNATNPDGGACDRYTPAYPVDRISASNTWGYAPNLMGWNGSATYGVRVDYARRATIVADISDSAPSEIAGAGQLWWESDTGRLKIYYNDGSSSQWVDVVPVVDTSLFFSKAGGAISGPVSINGTLDVTGNITATAEITAYYSDRRLKTDIVTIENALVKVKKLNGVTYRPNKLAKSYGLDTNSDVVGLFADEVEAVLPQAVKPAPFDVDENGNSKSGENYKTIQYEKVVPLLVEAIKDQQKIIEEQQAKIDRLMKHLGLE